MRKFPNLRYNVSNVAIDRGVNCIQTYVNVFGTKQSACNIVDGCFGVSLDWVPNERLGTKNKVT